MSGPDPLLPLLGLPGVVEAADTARAAVDRLLGHRLLRRGGERVSVESALRGARASAGLDGVLVPLDALRSEVSDEHGSDTPGSVGDPVVRAALRVAAGIGPLVRTWERAPAQALARLHVLAAAGRESDTVLGRPSGAGPSDRSSRVDTSGAAARLDGLARLVTGHSAVPAAVLAGVVHGELLAAAPFRVGGGLVARAAVRLTLATRGLDRRLVSVPEVGHLELREEYGPALAGYASGGPEGVGRWLRHCCAALTLGATEGLAICEALLRG